MWHLGDDGDGDTVYSGQLQQEMYNQNMKAVSDKDCRDAADELIQCLRSVTLEKHVKHMLIINLADEHRYEIYARIIEDLGEPVYLYDLAHQHPSYPQDLRFGVGTMQISRFHEFRNVERTTKHAQEFLQIIESRMEPFRQWLGRCKDQIPPFFKRYDEDDKYLIETITEPFSIHSEHFQ